MVAVVANSPRHTENARRYRRWQSSWAYWSLHRKPGPVDPDEDFERRLLAVVTFGGPDSTNIGRSLLILQERLWEVLEIEKLYRYE